MHFSSLVRSAFAIVAVGAVALGVAACEPEEETEGQSQDSLPEPVIPGVTGGEGGSSTSGPASPLVHAVGHSVPVVGTAIEDQVPGWTCGSAEQTHYGCKSDSGESFSFANVDGIWELSDGFREQFVETDHSKVVRDMHQGEYVSFPGGACAATGENELTCASLESHAGFVLDEDGRKELSEEEASEFFGGNILESGTPILPTRYLTVFFGGEEVTCGLNHRNGAPDVYCQGNDVDWGKAEGFDADANGVGFHTEGDGRKFAAAANMGQDMEGTTWLNEGTYNWMNSADVTYEDSELRIDYDGFEITVTQDSYDIVKAEREGSAVDLRSESVNVDGTERSYMVAAPQGWQNRRLPLIYVIHGKGSNPQRMSNATEFHKFADAIVVYPEGVDESWAPAYYAADPSGRSDLAFMDQLHNRLSNDFEVDQQRVYVSGFSNGGGFARYLSCQRPGRFPTITTVGAAVFESTVEDCAERPTNYLSFHGTDDDRVAFDGGPRKDNGEEYYLLGAEEALLTAAMDAECTAPRDGVELEENRVDGYPSRVKSIEHAGGCRNDLQLISIDEMGHRWPRGQEEYAGVDATIESLNFFDIEHTATRDEPDII